MLTVVEPAPATAPQGEPRGLRRLALLCGSIAFLIGALALLGWAVGINDLKRFDYGTVSVNPVTACCLIAAAAAILLHAESRSGVAGLIGAAVAVVGLAKLADLAAGTLPIDQLLFSGRLVEAAGALPNRMAPNTAMALLLVGSALALAGARSRAAQLASQLLALAAMQIAAFALLGHVFRIEPLSAVGPFIPMASNTAIAVLFLVIGTVALGRETALARVFCDTGPAGSMARMTLPLAILSPILIGALCLRGQQAGWFGLATGLALVTVANAAVNCVLLTLGIFALYRSDRDRKAREHSLRESEHFNRTLNQANPDCLWLLDSAGKLLFVNEVALRALGKTDLAEIAGCPWPQLFDHDDRRDAAAAIEVARGGKIGRLVTALPGLDGEPGWYESLVSRLDDRDSGPIAFVVMSRDITRQKAVEDQVRWAATHDSLTRLPNRALFQARLDELCLRARHGSEPAAVLMIDVDDFKRVNDTLGHDAGDALLTTVATRLRQSVRARDFVARLGGDEFAVILYGVRSRSAVKETASKLVESMKQPWLYEDRLSDCRISIGACMAAQSEDSSELLKKADIALYWAKLNGGGRIAVYQPEMREALQKSASELSLARDALDRDLVRPCYQPKVEIATGRLIGFEALLRWRHPTRGFQKPGLIRAAFEDVELAAALTDRMLASVLRDMRGWIDAGVDFGRIAVNAAAADFRQQGFAERLLDRLDEAGVPPARLQVEVTETVFLGRGAEYVERALKTLSAAGVLIALDDFGTGYASLSHLKQFPVDVIKIDRSFLRDVTDPHNAAIIRTVVSLGRSLELDVVAEGVETRAQERWLLSEGCMLGQGYLYGKGVPAAQVAGVVDARRGGVGIAA